MPLHYLHLISCVFCVSSCLSKNNKCQEKDVCLHTHTRQSNTWRPFCSCSDRVVFARVIISARRRACVHAWTRRRTGVLCNGRANSAGASSSFHYFFFHYLQRTSLTLTAVWNPVAPPTPKSPWLTPRPPPPSPPCSPSNCSSRNNKANPWPPLLNFWGFNYSKEVSVLHSHLKTRSLTHRHLPMLFSVSVFCVQPHHDTWAYCVCKIKCVCVCVA